MEAIDVSCESEFGLSFCRVHRPVAADDLWCQRNREHWCQGLLWNLSRRNRLEGFHGLRAQGARMSDWTQGTVIPIAITSRVAVPSLLFLLRCGHETGPPRAHS